MPAVRTAEEVYKKYIDRFGYDGDGDPDAIALFTYSLVEKDKYDWLMHYREQHDGADPAAADIENWYLSKPGSYFDEKYQRALWWYKSFARSLLEDEIKAERIEAVGKYVGERLKFLPQLWLSLATNTIFVVLLGALAMYVITDFSPIAWVKQHFSRDVGLH